MLALYQIILLITQNNTQCQVEFISYSADEQMNTQRAEGAEVHIADNRAATNSEPSSPPLLQSHFPEQFSLQLSTPFSVFVWYTHPHNPHYFSQLLLLFFLNTQLMNYHLLTELALTPTPNLGAGHLPHYPENTTLIDCYSISCKYHLIMVCLLCQPESSVMTETNLFSLYLHTQLITGISCAYIRQINLFNNIFIQLVMCAF